eukprot:CAMPEP_0174698070 /NCGR_PEP_ID=MMETSP1094-20130205/3753_1 /TAXON_ID=156173 /ORGANISM="Chrysochromulina brevifilum, Strain UTEX LB 985" /LENGTH=206 /DNA_ID=CAMNT_0015895171 /DNA_START=53 /DNA_END=670 /DNA_ORIENTATION=+
MSLTVVMFAPRQLLYRPSIWRGRQGFLSHHMCNTRDRITFIAPLPIHGPLDPLSALLVATQARDARNSAPGARCGSLVASIGELVPRADVSGGEEDRVRQARIPVLSKHLLLLHVWAAAKVGKGGHVPSMQRIDGKATTQADCPPSNLHQIDISRRPCADATLGSGPRAMLSAVLHDDLALWDVLEGAQSPADRLPLAKDLKVEAE